MGMSGNETAGGRRAGHDPNTDGAGTTPAHYEGTMTGGPVDFQPTLGPSARRDFPTRLGCYQLTRKLGEGGMGAVFLAEDTSLHRQVALKVMRAEVVSQSDAGQRFLREARSMAALKQDNIVTIYAVGEDQGIPYLAMELLKGASLDAFLKSGKVLSIKSLLRISREIARGLGVAHAKGLIHRDIKPGNIWLEAPVGRVKILDFGLARPAEEAGELTASGMVVGTPNYMSPEQARGEKVDARADLFSLGVLMYRMVTGRVPFQGPTLMAVLIAIGTETPTSVGKLKQDIPPRLSRLIDRLLAKRREDRPASADEVIAELTLIERDLGREAGGGAAAHAAEAGLVIEDMPAASDSFPSNSAVDREATEPVRAQSGSGSARKRVVVPRGIDETPEVVENSVRRRKKKKKVRQRKPTFPIVVGLGVLLLGALVVHQAASSRRLAIQAAAALASEQSAKPKQASPAPETIPETAPAPRDANEAEPTPEPEYRKDPPPRKGYDEEPDMRRPPKKDFRKGPFGKKDHPPKKDDGLFGDE